MLFQFSGVENRCFAHNSIGTPLILCVCVCMRRKIYMTRSCKSHKSMNNALKTHINIIVTQTNTRTKCDEITVNLFLSVLCVFVPNGVYVSLFVWRKKNIYEHSLWLLIQSCLLATTWYYSVCIENVYRWELVAQFCRFFRLLSEFRMVGLCFFPYDDWISGHFFQWFAFQMENSSWNYTLKCSK